MHNEWFADINHEFVGFALPFKRAGTLGVSASYLSFGELQGRDREGNETTIFPSLCSGTDTLVCPRLREFSRFRSERKIPERANC